MEQAAREQEWTEEKIEEKARDIGIGTDELRLILEDDDLWILSPEERTAFAGEEGARQWLETARFMRALADAFCNTYMVSDATSQLLRDADYRAHTAYERARQRASERVEEAPA